MAEITIEMNGVGEGRGGGWHRMSMKARYGRRAGATHEEEHVYK